MPGEAPRGHTRYGLAFSDKAAAEPMDVSIDHKRPS
jgi:hypothetical protein